MNPLQEHPHLFANGKFKFMANHVACALLELDICVGSPFLLFDEVESVWYSYKSCTLIARPISDMTDDEVQDIPRYITLNSVEEEKEEVSYKCKYKTLGYRDFLYLLSIGVYPFDQKDFDDGTVIDATTV